MWCCVAEGETAAENVRAAPSEATPAVEATSHFKEEASQIEPEPVVKEEEPAIFSTFEVECIVEKDVSLGLDVLATAVNHLVVQKLQPGVVSNYNSKQASNSTKVLPYDRILAINGEMSTAAMLEEKLKSCSGAITLKVERPNVLGVTITRADQKLGIDMQPKSNLGVVVTGIQAGCLVDYNQTAPLSRQVKVNDVIIGQFLKDTGGKHKVDKSKSPEDLMIYFQNDGPLGLAVLSYS